MRRRGFGTLLGGLGGALLLIVLNESPAGRHLWARLVAAVSSGTLPEPWLVGTVRRAAFEFATGARDLSGAFLTLASVATIGVVVARAAAYVRVREGRPDPIERLRARPGLQTWIRWTPAALFMLPAVVWLLSVAGEVGAGRSLAGWLSASVGGLIGSAGIAGLAYLATRAGLRALVAPVEMERDAPKEAGEIAFSAVA